MKNPLSAIAAQRIPFFIRNDYPRFAKLVEDFYKFLETNEHFLHVVETFSENTEINYEQDVFVQSFLSELGWNINRTYHFDLKLLVHTLREFYLQRGTPESFDYFFKVLFGSGAVISYPREQLFICSGASLSNNQWILTSGNNFSNSYLELDYLNIELKGLASGVTVFVNEIFPFYKDGILYLSILIENTRSEFAPEEQVQITFGNKKIVEIIYLNLDIVIQKTGSNYSIGDTVEVTGATIPGEVVVDAISLGKIDGISVITRGSGYALGDLVTAAYDEENSGRGFTAKVSGITTGGAIKTVTVTNTGYNFNKFPTLAISSVAGAGAVLKAQSNSIGGIKKLKVNKEFWKFDSPETSTYSIITNTGEGAELELFLKSCINRKEKIYNDKRGFIGINSKLLDSNYYQNFSYTIEGAASKNQAQDLVKAFVHPFGYQNFFIFSLNLQEEYEIENSEIRLSIGLPIQEYSNTANTSTSDLLFVRAFEITPDVSTIWGINMLDAIKFEDSFLFPIGDFASIVISDENVFIGQTLDPQIELV
jgi:hypothetical protein